MSTPSVAGAEQLAARLLSAGIPATHDPGQLLGKLPAVLIPPPRMTFDTGAGPTFTWRLLVVAGVPDQLAAWQQIDELVALVADELPVELAEPVSFALAPDVDPLPAYALTLTD